MWCGDQSKGENRPVRKQPVWLRAWNFAKAFFWFKRVKLLQYFLSKLGQWPSLVHLGNATVVFSIWNTVQVSISIQNLIWTNLCLLLKTAWKNEIYIFPWIVEITSSVDCKMPVLRDRIKNVGSLRCSGSPQLLVCIWFVQYYNPNELLGWRFASEVNHPAGECPTRLTLISWWHQNTQFRLFEHK